MNDISNDLLPKNRLFGRFGTYDSYFEDDEKKIGFIIVKSSISKAILESYDIQLLQIGEEFWPQFDVFESDVLGSGKYWGAGLLVTFRLVARDGNLGVTDVKKFFDETETYPLLEFVQKELKKEDFDDFSACFLACFQISERDIDLAYPTIAELCRLFDRYYKRDDYKTRHVKFESIPEFWKNPDSLIYQVLPAHLREELLFKRFEGLTDDFGGVVYKRIQYSGGSFPQPVSVPLGSGLANYSELTKQDVELAMSWVSTDSDYEKAKMLSARYAELKVAKFFRNLGHTVEDIALHQINKQSDDWKTHDLLIDGCIPVDVKNSRLTVNGKTFVQHTVKSFKKDRLDRDVKIVGVLSPYLQYEDMTKSDVDDPDHNIFEILGETSFEAVSKLQDEFSKRNLKVEFGYTDSWPIWIFNHDPRCFADQKQSLDQFVRFARQFKASDWEDLRKPPIPQFLISQTAIPTTIKNRFLPWQVWYLNKLEQKSMKDGLTLPWLFLFTFQHFIDAVSEIKSAEMQNYSPVGYEDILFLTNDPQMFCVPRNDQDYPYPHYDHYRPAGLHDPLRVVERLIASLAVLWEARYSAQLGSLKSFVLKGQGLLRAIDQNDRRVTVMAYCGGFIQTKGHCGNFPLIKGKHETCDSCGMLICDKCGHCSDQCKHEC